MALDEATRVRLGVRTDLGPDALHALATDRSVTVRAALAMNPASPAATNQELARDADERVRALIARKLAAMAPSLSDGARDRLRQDTYDTLIVLAGDAAVRVRAAIAEAIQDMPDAPRAMVTRLARDEAESVCEPVIRFSPQLTMDDLLALVAEAPSAGTRLAVARRADIDAAVCDALADGGTDDVLLALLMNGSAQIREATLDALVERSVNHPDWHAPLIGRPVLSARSLRTLARIVADHLVDELAARGDLDAETVADLRARVDARIAPDAKVAPIRLPEKPTEDDVLTAARSGDARAAAMLLSAASGLPLSVIRRASTLRSAKGLVSLAWKAGLTMKSGYALQILLARLSPNVALKAAPGNNFPLSVQEMRWQLDFLTGESD